MTSPVQNCSVQQAIIHWRADNLSISEIQVKVTRHYGQSMSRDEIRAVLEGKTK